MTPATRPPSSAWLRPARNCGRSRPDILDASFKATNELFAEVSAKNAKFKALYKSTIAFRNEQYQWHQVCEATYDNYMIRRIRG